MVPQVPENKAMVIYGRKSAPGMKMGYIVLTRGGRSPLPIVESVEMMDIGPQKIELDHRDVKVVDGGVDRIAQVMARAVIRVPEDPDVLKVAVEHLLHVSYRDVGRMAGNIFEAHMRGVLRTTPWEEAKDPMTTAIRVREMMELDLLNIGVAVEELTIQELKLRGG